MVSQRERILKILNDGKWHCVRELHAVCWRYGARLHEIRETCVLEKRRCPDARCRKANLEQWRRK